MTGEKDLVLIYFEGSPLVFARIEDISADVKKDWYQVKLLMLQLPLQTITWILRDVYIDGQEFTMNGKTVRLEKVEAPADIDGVERINDSEKGAEEVPLEKKPLAKKDSDASFPPKSTGKIISLADHKSS